MMISYDRSAVPQAAAAPFVRQAADEPDDGLDIDLTELQVADYIVFLLALETYMGWLQETGRGEDETLKNGVALARVAERQNLEAIGAFIKSNLSDKATKATFALLDAALRPPPTPRGLALRAVKLRTVLSKGGTATTKAVFGTSAKAKGQVQEAIDASMIDDPDAALNKFAVLTLKNKKLEKWIDEASAVCVTPGTAQISPVREAARGATDASAELVKAQVIQDVKSGTDASADARDKQTQVLTRVQSDATAAAKKAMDQAGEVDRPLTKAEVIGVATAAAVAVSSDTDKVQNVPPALAKLDPEQRAAAMTGGKVRVSAGAGSGKSTTLLARVQYLIDGGATPNRMMAMSFNKKAADELAIKMAGKIGDDRVSTTQKPNPNGVRVGTMHAVFLKFINEYGLPEQKAMFAKVNNRGGIVKAEKIFSAVKEVWDECFRDIDKNPPGDPDGTPRELPQDELWKMPPKSKRMMAYLNLFQGQGWSLAQATEWAKNEDALEADQALKFFEVYEGLKGGLGAAWRPNFCPEKPSRAFDKFVKSNRDGKSQAGDFNDMLAVFHNIMKTQPLAQKKVQEQFDHIMVDECQDLNPLQFDILQMMTEHVETDDPKKSFWMVGDDKQSIYQFRGADPNNFIALDQMGFKDRQITTNYRCAPEFVDAANKLIAVNENQIPMEAKAAPSRARGEASLRVLKVQDEVAAARVFGAKIRDAVAAGEPLSNFAVLARTNAELGVYQQMCAALGIRYVQKKATSVFSAQESEAFRAFASSVVASSPAQVQDQFCQTLMSAGLLNPKLDVDRTENQKKALQTMKGVFREYCSRNRIDLNTFDPIEAAANTSTFLPFVLSKFGVPDFGAKKDAAKAGPLLQGVLQLQEYMADPDFTSKDLFAGIMALPVVSLVPPDQSPTGKWQEIIQTFGDSTVKRLAARAAQEDADEDSELGDDKGPGLGMLDFVYDMLQPNDVDPNYNPQNPRQFFDRFEGLAAKGAELRMDPDVWDKKQAEEGIPLAQRTPPPGVYLGTVHSTKGAEWEDVTLLMPLGVFPAQRMPPKPRLNQVPEHDFVDSQSKMESERRLGYVGLTRAKKVMTILGPGGLSPFVEQAGLKVGQNVPQPATSISGEVLATTADVAAAENDGEEAITIEDDDLLPFGDEDDRMVDHLMRQAGLGLRRQKTASDASPTQGYSYQRSAK